jgi:molybdenum ABC transporter molybdate-binding protein
MTTPGKDWAIGVRVWAERGGQAVLGPGRLELLEQIAARRSISAAARHLGMSYRRAWEMVQAINQAAGAALVTAATGGAGGGGAGLTTLGQRTVAEFRALTDRLSRAAEAPDRGAGPRPIHVLAAVSLEEVVGRVLADFTDVCRAARVRTVFGASDELATLIRAGAPADLFLTADSRQLDRLHPAPTRRVVLAANALAVIAPTDTALSPGPPGRLLRRPDLRLALADAGCPLGGYTSKYLAAAGIRMSPNRPVVRADNSRGVVAAVRSARADLGVVYASDAAHADGCCILGRIDRPRVAIRYEAAAVAAVADDNPAAQLLRFLTSDAAAARFRECGFRVERPR